MAKRRKPAAPGAFIPPPSRTGRDRSWEKSKRQQPDLKAVTYRDIPVEVIEYIKQLAAGQYVTVNEIARLFLEHAIRQHESGELDLGRATFDAGKMTFFPKNE